MPVPRLPDSPAAVCALLLAATGLLPPGDVADAADVTFADLSPILQQRCVICHSGPAAPRGLQLDSLEGVLAGSDRGVIVKAGDPQGSELVRRLKGSSVPRMPMTGPPFLADAEIAMFAAWIAGGLPVMEAGNTVTAGTVEDPKTLPKPSASPVEGPPTFAQVAMIFATRCAKCHTDNGLMGAAPEGYRLTSYAAVIASRDRVRVVPGNPAASELLRRIRGQTRPRMPFDGPPYLSDEEIRLIERWIAAGARSTLGDVAPVPVGKRVRLHGTLSRRWMMDDLPLTVTPATRIDKNPQAGDPVRVRGRVQADGSIQVDRIIRR